MSLRLRCKTKKGQYNIVGLSPDSLVGELKAKIAAATGIPPASLIIKYSFPPEVVKFEGDDQKLSDFAFRSGDTLTVDEMATELPALPSAATLEKPVAASSDLPRDVPVAVPASPGFSNLGGEDDGVMIRVVVPANNSCLFTSINAALSGGEVDLKSAQPLREKVAVAIQRDQEFSDAMLGRPKEEYLSWIQTESAWGGAIELAVLAKLFRIEISAIDIQTCMEQRFGEGQGYTERIILIYDGTHYDLMAVDLGGGVKMTRFDVLDDMSLAKALSFAKDAQTKRMFTDFASFTLRCKVCQKPLVGQAEANEHAKETGHINYEEYRS